MAFNEMSENSDANATETGNPSMADAMRKVLSIGKNSNSTSLILAKAKLITNDEKTKKPKTSVDKLVDNGVHKIKDENDVKLISNTSKKKRVKKQEVASLGRLKPSPLDREIEKPLVKIATRGVVQLFNAVREQQKIIEKNIKEVGPSIAKKEKVLKSIDKKGFLDVLRGCKPISTLSLPENEIKTEDEDADDEPGWQVLRDDFMMGAKLKDWDKKEKSKNEDEEAEPAKKQRK